MRKRNSIRLCCFYCAVLGSLLWLLMFSVSVPLNAADESGTAFKSQKTDGAKRYETKKKHSPDGIGKFYMGREIALVMGFQAADWLERPEREDEERLTLLVKELKLKPGQTIADIGAGSGVISIMMAEQVGEKGLVYAVDIQPQMLRILGDKLKNDGIKNIELIQATEKSPELPPQSVDLALMVDVYHEFEFPYETILALSQALKPGGRVAFVEYRREDPEVPIKLIHKMSEAQIKKEIGQPEFGLKWKETIKSLPRQHIVIFERQQDS